MEYNLDIEKEKNIFRLDKDLRIIEKHPDSESISIFYKNELKFLKEDPFFIINQLKTEGFYTVEKEIKDYLVSFHFYLSPVQDEFLLRIEINKETAAKEKRDGLISLNKNGVILEILDKSEIPGKNCSAFIGDVFPEYGDQFLNKEENFYSIIKTLEENEIEEFIWWIKNTNGTFNPTELGIQKKGDKFYIWKNEVKERLNYLKNIMLHEERLNLALEATQTVLWDWDILNEKVFWSENSTYFFNTKDLDKDKSFGQLLTFIHPDCVENVKTAINDTLFNKKELEVEFYTQRKGERLVWMELRGKVHSNANGEPIRMIGSIRDITSKKITQIKLSETKENYQLLVDNIPIGIIIRSEKSFQFINNAALQIFGFKDMKGIINKNLGKILGKKELKLFNEHYSNVSKGKKIGKSEFSLGNDTDGYNSYQLESRQTIYNGIEAVNHFIYDITKEKSFFQERARAEIAEELNAVLKSEIKEHKKTQRKLLEAESFSRNIIDSSLDFIIAFDNKGKVQEFNIAAQKLFNYEFKDVVKMNDFEFINSKKSFKKLKRELEEKNRYHNEFNFVKSDGSKFLGLFAASVIWDDKMQKSGYMMVGRDVTHIRKTENRIKESEKKYRDLFENSTDLIQSIDVDGNILYVNKAWLQTLGYSESEALKMNIKDLISSESNYFDLDIYLQSLFHESDNPLKVIVYKAKNGQKFILEGNSSINYEKERPVSSRSIFRNITDVRKAREKIRNQAAKLNSIYNSSSHIFWTVDNRICLTSFNKKYVEAIYSNYGVYPELNTDYSHVKNKFADGEWHSFWNNKYKEAFDGNMVHFETETTDLDGKKVYREVFLNPVINNSGEINEVAGIANDITDKKLAEENFREQTAKINSIFESAANMVIFTINRENEILSFNRNLAKTLLLNYGVTIEIGNKIEYNEISKFSGSLDKIKKVIEATFEGKTQHLEIKIINARGTENWYEIYLNPVHLEYKKINEISCIAFEISHRKETEDKLLNSLKDKEVLLKEVHHRVKNNLQVISSILSLQTKYVKDKNTLGILQESQNRIKSMSFIHESLYQNKDFTSISMSEYISTLTQNLFYSYRIKGEKIKLSTRIEDVFLNIDQAIPCGLIINELVSNALKYAFSNREKGKIKVEVNKNRNVISLEVADDGIGLPSAMELGQSDTLGFQLVQALVDQLDAKMSVDREKGTKYLITFEQNPI